MIFPADSAEMLFSIMGEAETASLLGLLKIECCSMLL